MTIYNNNVILLNFPHDKIYGMIDDISVTCFISARNKSATGHFMTKFSIWPIKVNFGSPNFQYTCNETAISNL